MGRTRKRKGRQIDGIFLLDKPIGMSSNHALQKIKRTFNANKAGHTGSLDVPASGLLPICLGEATKFSSFLLNANKVYIVEARLGKTTNTGDAAGEVLLERDVDEITEKKLETICAMFIGEIEQVPPMFSALKHNGKRLHELAYQGIEVERPARRITIFRITLLGLDQTSFQIRVHCSKGTYIRTLIQDIGEKLGCGAHVLNLRRLQSGPFTEQQMMTFEELEKIAEKGYPKLDELLFSIDSPLSNLPSIQLNQEQSTAICYGQKVSVEMDSETEQIRVYDATNRFLGIGKLNNDGELSAKRLINI